MTHVVVFDYGSGNVRSACRALEHVGADVELTADREAALNADGLLVPGVGAFHAVMRQLRVADGENIIDMRLAGGRLVKRLDAEVVPHMGWSPIEAATGSELFAGVEDQRFYFVHSYGVHDDPTAAFAGGVTTPPLTSWARHGNSRFVAAVENGPLSATQFHPEKSGDAGMTLLTNWLDTLK